MKTKKPSAAPDATARACAARSRAPTRPATACTKASDSARHNANWPSSPVTRSLIFLSLAFLPAAGAFQRIDDFGRHVFLVVLGEDLRRVEHAAGIECAHRDHALSFAEQIGQHAVVSNGHARASIRDHEMD